MVARTQVVDVDRIRWDDVRVFLALYRARTLAGAGARVGLDASTLSRRLTALEDAIGAHLFDRTRDGLAPTEAAELILGAAEEMEAGHARFGRDASSLETLAEGVVRLSVPPGVSDAFVGPALVRLHQEHPRIRIEVDASVRILDLTRREADLALRSVRPHGGDLVMTKVLTTTWIPLAAPELSRTRESVRDVEAIPWIAWGEDFAGLGAARWLAKYAPKAEVRLRTSHFATQIAAAKSGLGALLAPEIYARVIEGLVPLRLGSTLDAAKRALPEDDFWLVGHRALRDVPRVAAVWNFLARELAELA
jgi:DNA-binding transcriptional LysR family regulator